MHKGVILLTKAEDIYRAINKVEDFLEGYGDGKVWDWYVIGGRWSGVLISTAAKFDKMAREHMANVYSNPEFITIKMIEELADELQKIWVGLGNPTQNLWCRNQYKSEFELGDNIIPLSDCIDVVMDWTIDMPLKGEEYFQKVVEMRERGDIFMSGYYAGLYNECVHDNFSFDSYVYDMDNHTNNPEIALQNPEGWFAVMVDMHN